MNEEAGIHDDLIITKINQGFIIVLNAACKKKDFEIIKGLLNNKYEMKLRLIYPDIPFWRAEQAGWLYSLVE